MCVRRKNFAVHSSFFSTYILCIDSIIRNGGKYKYDRIVLNYNFKDGTVSLSYDDINNIFGSYLKEPAPPARKKPNQVFTRTTFGFVVSMESLEELYERYCGRNN